MIDWVVACAEQLHAEPIIVVVGHGTDLVMDALHDRNVAFAVQKEQLGTAHAVEQARPLLVGFQGDVLVLSGDVPGIQPATLNALRSTHLEKTARATMLTAQFDNPTGYGRVLRDSNDHLLRVVEEKDATAEEKQVREINAGIYIFQAETLFEALPKVKNENKQGEYYLPDVLNVLQEQKMRVAVELTKDYHQIRGVNTLAELRSMD